MVFPCSLYRRQQGGDYNISTSSETKRLMLAVFQIAVSTDLELLRLKGSHGAPEYHLGPHIKQNYLCHSSTALARSGNSLKGSR